MNGWIRDSRTGRGIFALFLLLALAVRIAIPTGFMPTLSAKGVVISLCTGQGAMNVVVDRTALGKTAPADHRDRGESSPCVFAAGLAGGLLPSPVPAIVASFTAAVALARGAAIADLTVHRLAAPPPPSRGPPAQR